MRILIFFLLLLLPLVSQANRPCGYKVKYVASIFKEDSDKQHLKLIKYAAGHERFGKSKKIKQRGMGSDCPSVSNVSFGNVFTYKVALFFCPENTYASFLHCVECKRGPPVGL